jgi:hypothetical protein
MEWYLDAENTSSCLFSKTTKNMQKGVDKWGWVGYNTLALERAAQTDSESHRTAKRNFKKFLTNGSECAKIIRLLSRAALV